MDKIAYLAGSTPVYWHNIILTLAALTAMCFFLAFYLGRSGNFAAGFAVLPLSLGMSLVLARFFHWYCRNDSYPGFLAAMTDHSSGDYALMGVFLGCYLGAVLTKLLRLHRNLPQMLDCMCLGGAAGISVGRLASLFDSSDRGQMLENFRSLPFASPVTNAVSGATEYRLATFMLQAMVALVLFLSLAAFFRNRKPGKQDGDTCLIFLLCYGASQVVLDSTRYDSLFFRSNGFVSIVQVLGALALVLAIWVFSRRLVRNKGFHFLYLGLWIPIAAAMGCAGFMEYYVQRHGSTALFSYSIMTLCLLAVVILTLRIRTMAGQRPPRRGRAGG